MSNYPFSRFDYTNAKTYSPIGFQYTDPSQVKVILVDKIGRPQTLVYNSDYTVSGDSITLAPGKTYDIEPVKVFVLRDTMTADSPAFQSGVYLDVKKVQKALETMRTQIIELKMNVDNSVKVSGQEWHQDNGDNPVTIPPEAERKGRILAFDDDGNVLMVLTKDIEQNLKEAKEAELHSIAIKNDVDSSKSTVLGALADSLQAVKDAKAEVNKAEGHVTKASTYASQAYGSLEETQKAEARVLALNGQILQYNDAARQWVEGPQSSGKEPGVDYNAQYLAAQSEKARKEAVAAANAALGYEQDALAHKNEAERQASLTKRYYIPSVDEDGNLSWTATQGDMTKIPTQNVYGDRFLQMLEEMIEIKSQQSIKFGYAEYSKDDFFIHFYDYQGGTELGVAGPVVGGAGSGGGGAQASSQILVNAVDFGSSKTVPYGADCILTFNWSSTTSSGPTGEGSLTVNINGRNVIVDRDIAQGVVEVNIRDYLTENATNTVKLTIKDLYGSQAILVCRVKAISFYLYAPSFHEDDIRQGAFLFSFYPYGEGEKTVHVVIDGVTELTKVTSANGRVDSIEVPALSHGTHSMEAWFTSEINGREVECEHLKYQIIATEEGHAEPIIAMRLDGGYLKQYYTTAIRYQIWTTRQTTAATLNDGATTITLDEVDKTEHTWSVRKDEVGTATFAITAGGYTKELTVEVVDSGIILRPATTNLELFLTSKGHVVGSPLEWGYGDIQCQFNAAANAPSCGWQMDDDNIPVMRLKGDARMTVPFKIFGKEVSVTGKTIELEFATSKVFDYDTVIMDCLSGGRGFEATAQAVTLYSSENQLFTQYKEDEHVRISFVISASNDPTQGRIVYCYINGIMSGAYQYSTDLFEQTVPEDLVIGSNGCTTDVYCIRVYDRTLSRYEIVDNWLADIQNGAELLKQYQANDIYSNDRVTVEKLLARKLPCLVIDGVLPGDKGDVKTVSGYYTDPEDSSRSFDFSGAEIDVQGTSSKDYAVKNYKIKFKGGFKMASGSTVGKYSIGENGMPVDTFTFKADYASSEGANNVELVKLYNDIDPWRSPLQSEDRRVRQGIDGYPIAIFHVNQDTGVTEFVGKYNFNNDKGTADVFGFSEGDQSWEITGNGADTQLFKAADFNTYADVHEDFESRYPKEPGEDSPLWTDPAFVADLKAMVTWVASTDTTAEGLTEEQKAQRLQKFKEEFDSWFDRDSTFFYYLFTEFFLMVDSRAKNAFPTKYTADGKWAWLPYDMDTALGIDNGGRLMFSYNLEDTDVINGATVYNGQNSVLWNNLRECFGKELSEFYENRIRNSNQFNFEAIEKQFEDHQYKWPVALWNEDASFKYIDTLIKKNDDRLYMLQGSKEAQRKWWLFNRFRYIDSKYNAGLAKQKTIVFRAYANNKGTYSEFDITPYADIYASADFDEKSDRKAARRGETTTLRIEGIANPNNLVVRIYSADQLASVGDLSGFLPDEVKLSDAVNLQSIKVGGVEDGYTNPQLKSLTLGSNVLLKEIDARNCINLNTAIDASKCESIEHIRLENTKVPSVALPSGAPLKSLHLPETLTSLELRNLSSLEDFYIEGSPEFARLWIENPTDAIAAKVTSMVVGMPVGSRLRVRGLQLTVDNEADLVAFLNRMDELKGLDAQGNPTEEKAQVSGTIVLHDTMTKGDLDHFSAEYPDLTLVPDRVVSRVTFMSEDGSTILQQKEVEYLSTVTYTGTQPTKEMTVDKVYSFVGWSYTPNSEGSTVQQIVATGNDILYAQFYWQTRQYTIKFVNDNGAVLQSGLWDYGSTPVYSGSTPVTSDTSGDYGGFKQWDSDIVPVAGDKTYKAMYILVASITRKTIARTIKSVSDENLTSIGKYAFSNCRELVSATFPNATAISENAFESCVKLESVSFDYVTVLSGYSFTDCSSLTSASFPNVTKITGNAFMRCTSLKYGYFPKLKDINTNAFYSTGLRELIIGTEIEEVCVLQRASYITGSSDLTIYVPDSLVDSYRSNTNWANFNIKGISERT